MRIDVMTLFPEACRPYTDTSIVGKAQKKGILEVHYHYIRDYSDNKHRRVDDYTYGGGMGLLIKPEPVCRCYEHICGELGYRPPLYYLSAQGKPFKQADAFALSKTDGFVLLCGQYEGVDQRVLDEIVDGEISLGDFVLTGGELGALVVIDATARLLDGVLSGEECYLDESHTNGLLEYPQYTHPSVWRGIPIPDVLLSGHHENIRKWRREQALRVTARKRPDMLK